MLNLVSTSALIGLSFSAIGQAAETNVTVQIPWSEARVKARSFISQLNLTEKVSMVTGSSASASGCIGNINPIPRLNFSGLCIQDGPAGMNRADLVSVFPAGLTIAATWDRTLMRLRGEAIGSEFRQKGSHVYLGPSAGPLGRHATGGRNWEGFSPDPYLTGIAMKETIGGVQSTGVQTTSKHFIGNEQELLRTQLTFANGSVHVEAYSSNIDDKTLHELYLWPFADALKAGTTSIMCAYNRVDETYSCENAHILNEILKGELGFEGYVMSDFFATHSGAKSARNGLDMNMPGSISQSSSVSWWGSNLVADVNNGSVTVDRLDNMIERIMTPYFALGQDSGFPTVDPALIMVLGTQFQFSPGREFEVEARDVRADHAKLIRKIGAEGTVLLKNLNGTLPLRNIKNLGLFGNDAANPTSAAAQSFFSTTLQSPEFGTLDIGGGSGTVRHSGIVSPFEAIMARSMAEGIRTQYILDNKVLVQGDFTSLYPTPEICLVFLKSWASEGADRPNLDLEWNATTVVENVALKCPKTIVITHSAGVHLMPWATNPNVTAILSASYPGEQTGNSIADILFGDVSPSAKLPFTIPKLETDCEIPIFNVSSEDYYKTEAWQVNFTEGHLIDYRCFDAKNVEPLYEFGFGLTYSEFEVAEELIVDNNSPGALAQYPNANLQVAPGGNPDLWTVLRTVSTIVNNTGSVAAANVVQLYLSLPSEANNHSLAPPRILRGFEKVFLQPGETKPVRFELTRRDMSYWDVAAQQWKIPQGEFTVQVGFSSRDLQQNATLALC